MDRLVYFLRRRRWARRALSGASVVLLLCAVGFLGYPFYTNLYQGRVQDRLDRELASPALAQRYRSASLTTGDALTRLKIPKLGVAVVVVEGTTAKRFGRAPGTTPRRRCHAHEATSASPGTGPPTGDRSRTSTGSVRATRSSWRLRSAAAPTR